MKSINQDSINPRRSFLRKLSGSAAALMLTSLAFPFKAEAAPLTTKENNLISGGEWDEAENWFDKVTGKHKMAFDITKHNGGLFLTFVMNFLNTNNKTGTSDNELSAIVSFRHFGVAVAMNDSIWEKYTLAEHLELKDADTKEFAKRNVFYDVKLTDSFPKDRSIKHLQSRGVLFCVCDIGVESLADWMADEMKLNQHDVRKDFYANILPDVQLVPSGIWALGRAQEHGCGYCSGQ